jgi:hypothetical protein
MFSLALVKPTQAARLDVLNKAEPWLLDAANRARKSRLLMHPMEMETDRCIHTKFHRRQVAQPPDRF